MHIKKQEMQRHYLLIILLVHTVLGLDKCQDGYIPRQIWTNRHRRKNICCKKVTENCKQGYYLKTCTGRSNLSRDVCTPCPGTTWLADETNSTNVHKCVPYSCSNGAKRVDYLPKSGCNMPCVCETERKFYGFDSCNCKLFEGTCPEKTKLALNGICLSNRDANVLNDLRPKDGLVAIPIKAIIKKTSGTKNDSSRNTDNSWSVNGWIITGSVLAFIVLVILIICLVVCIWRRCKKDTHGKEIPPKPTESISNVSDSGVSFTTSSSAYELDEISHEQQRLVNKIDHKHTSDQTEKKIDIKCVSDQRDDKTNEPCQQTTYEPCQQTTCEPCQQTTCEPCQQTTLVEINKQDQIVKPRIKDEVKVLCHTNASENVSKYFPRRETSKYSSQNETEKQVAKIPPFRSEDDMTKVTDPLLGSSDGGGGYHEHQINFQRPPDINDHHLNVDHTELIPMDYDFGSSLRMSSSLDNISDT